LMAPAFPATDVPPAAEAPPSIEFPPCTDAPPVAKAPPVVDRPPVAEAPPASDVPPTADLPAVFEAPPPDAPPPSAADVPPVGDAPDVDPPAADVPAGLPKSLVPCEPDLPEQATNTPRESHTAARRMDGYYARWVRCLPWFQARRTVNAPFVHWPAGARLDLAVARCEPAEVETNSR